MSKLWVWCALYLLFLYLVCIIYSFALSILALSPSYYLSWLVSHKYDWWVVFAPEGALSVLVINRICQVDTLEVRRLVFTSIAECKNNKWKIAILNILKACVLHRSNTTLILQKDQHEFSKMAYRRLLTVFILYYSPLRHIWLYQKCMYIQHHSWCVFNSLQCHRYHVNITELNLFYHYINKVVRTSAHCEQWS